MTALRSTSQPLVPFGLRLQIDLSQPLSPEGAIEFRDLFHEHKLLVASGQQLTLEQQWQVMSYIGPVDRENPTAYLAPDDKILGANRIGFHSDMGFVPHPLEATSLHALDVEDGQTWTAFLDAGAAYRRLPPSLADELASLRVIRVASASSEDDDEIPPFDTPEGVHALERDLIMRHPATDEPILYVSPGSTSRIVGFSEAESTALLRTIYQYLYVEDYIYRHHWRVGDFVVWDNLALQHARPNLAGVTRRKLQRSTVATHNQRDQTPASFKSPEELSRERARSID